jgi:hypothetical protein
MTVRVLVAALTVFAFGLQAQEKAPQLDSIRKDDMRADLFFLAGDSMKGRVTNSPTNLIAAEFIQSRFERVGLKPAGPEGSYFQHYNLIEPVIGEENSLEVLNGDGPRIKLRMLHKSFYPEYFSVSGHAQGSLVFAGFGMTVPDLNYDDYRRANLSGKIVLVLDHEPGEKDPSSPFDGLVLSDSSQPLRKALFAQAHGAAGILFARDVHNHPGPENFGEVARSNWPAFSLASWIGKVRIPAAAISSSLASILIRDTHKTLEELSKSAETPTGIEPIAVPGIQVSLTTNVVRRTILDRNVIGLVEGSDPKLRDEYVIVCAHYDHEGAVGTQIYDGADDDGSGVVGLIEIAQAYGLAARAGQRPRRTVMFAAWNSEERGLLGSWAYTEYPLLPLDKLVAVLNMDMIGRNEEIQVGADERFRGMEVQSAESNSNALNIIGTLRSPDLKQETERANKVIGLDLKFRYDNNISNLLRRSDHWPFIQHGVPAIWIFTGLHPDYHTVYDRPAKINYGKMEKVVRCVYQESWDLATEETHPKLLPRKPEAQAVPSPNSR